MKHTRRTPAVTSLPPSPQDEASHRVRRYALTMGIRTLCFLLMALVQPVGWWTFVFAAGAIFLPYLAVVSANAGRDSTPSTIESPALQLDAPAPAASDDQARPDVFVIHEHRDTDAGTAESADPAQPGDSDQVDGGGAGADQAETPRAEADRDGPEADDAA